MTRARCIICKNHFKTRKGVNTQCPYCAGVLEDKRARAAHSKYPAT